MIQNDIEKSISILQQRLLDIETRVGSPKTLDIIPLSLNATQQDIIFKINELIKIINTRLR